MTQFKQFNKAIKLEQISENEFKFRPDQNYSVGATPHGGYLMALMHKALTTVLQHSCAINSNIFYLDRTDHDEAILRVKIIKVSRGSSMGAVELIQNDKTTCIFNGLCTDLDKLSGFSDLPSPLPNNFHKTKESDFQVMNYDHLKEGFTPNFIKQLNIKVDPDHAWWSRADFNGNFEARCSAYIELEGGTQDQYMLSYFSDILPPVTINKYGPIGWIPTLSLTTNIRQLPTTDKLFIDGTATDIINGYFEQNVNIWDLNENLILTSRQIAKILKSSEKLSKFKK